MNCKWHNKESCPSCPFWFPRASWLYAIINLTVIGISHVLRPRVWVDFIVLLRERGEAGVFAVAVLNLVFGSIIVAFHNVWSGLGLVLTLLGWVNVVKALLYFMFPAFGLRKLQFLSHERANLVVGGGFLSLLLAAISLWQKGSDPLRASDFQGESIALQRVRPLLPQAAILACHVWSTS